ncbi:MULTISPECIES: ABC transporter ATP-binding protein [unclassified Chelatococcus]|uniref:ABC transporter ATP-binding protein n=1 Tax=unclassified Chelatococcus TaxID=2638111 RepID=UPI001BCE235F|nr:MULTISPECIES: ABC transporter ATP-binding protein [unclassified Chelatococcus]CAH1649533.1 Spermidine/putrescine import ATP-binding protein PotA [Hyphomicrobiales bacterium]MBS7741751.1 ABC transporter ATP-binding protein [Chelatococcus sp. HY11]MBX3541451.1 ABC transporter ATP-binding protein [Chelatococcus sp.]MCO5074655.1 ABC transporter ATP-binding protein [Chelatococcus sp.]CAH1692017.1 Spermidine/putrescine import ATP-binding protein PotA [Hyphomicrobiales bacterium]
MAEPAPRPTRGRIAIRDVAKSYDGAPALRDINLDAAPGEFIALLGPSGCGKTTLLRCIAGLINADRGDIRVDDRSLVETAPWKRDISVVFQSYALFPHMSVAQNVAFGLKMRRLDKAVVARRVAHALDLVQMTTFAERRPAQLSGGQQQRVALARAIVVEPTILLLDEPLAALDAKLRASVQIEIRSLQKRLGVTTILVTHDQAEAMTMSDRIAVMNAGRIEQIGRPLDLYNQPATPFVADFVGETNRLHGETRPTSAGSMFHLVEATRDFPLSQSHLSPGPATLMVRPENIRLGRDAAGLPGTVEHTALIGDRFQITLSALGLTLRATVLNNTAAGGIPAPGDRVSVAWRAEDALAFPGHV